MRALWRRLVMISWDVVMVSWDDILGCFCDLDNSLMRATCAPACAGALCAGLCGLMAPPVCHKTLHKPKLREIALCALWGDTGFIGKVLMQPYARFFLIGFFLGRT